MIHIGQYIKETILPKGLSIKNAAKLLGVGRPALSALVNQRAALSPEMAQRLEKCFGIKASDLLERQARLTSQISDYSIAREVKTFMPTFFNITSTDISKWASSGLERTKLLPVLMRMLVNSSDNPSLSNFPGNDNSQKKGWDGYVETNMGNQWVPEGKSGWEFGVSATISTKANRDFVRRTYGDNALTPQIRKEITFIFVTPHEWTKKSDWVKEKESLNLWKAIKAYDANDIEQWIEQTIVVQHWFNHITNKTPSRTRTLTEQWILWSKLPKNQTLSPHFFNSIIKPNSQKFKEWIGAKKRPFYIHGPSVLQCQAFIFSLLNHFDPMLGDNTLCVDDINDLNKIRQFKNNTIIVLAHKEVTNYAVSQEVFKDHNLFIINFPHGYKRKADDISIDRISKEAFREALLQMGIREDRTQKLCTQSGHSLHILRAIFRNTSTNLFDHLRDKSILIQMILIGRWNSDNHADKNILNQFANVEEYSIIDKHFTKLLSSHENCPVWKVGNIQGFTSRFSALYEVGKYITKTEILNFLIVCQLVLSEEDPAIDLPYDNIIFAKLLGKTRKHSTILRESICESLCLLAIYGNTFMPNIDLDFQKETNELVASLLQPISHKQWLNHKQDLTYYAEISPEAFLNSLEFDLKSSNPEIIKLLKPVEGHFFAENNRSELLWGLEKLVWDSVYFERVVLILIQLAQVPIKDNILNKPINTLHSIFRSWIPQTSAPIEKRKALLNKLVTQYPKIGIQICLAQFDSTNTTSWPTERPIWRDSDIGYGNVTTNKERLLMMRFCFEKILSLDTKETWIIEILLRRLNTLLLLDQVRVLKETLKWWEKSQLDQTEKESIRDTLRVCVSEIKNTENPEEQAFNRALSDLHFKTNAQDLLEKNLWLFQEYWIRQPYKEENIEYKKWDTQIHDNRSAAIVDIYNAWNLSGILKLINSVKEYWLIGSYVGQFLSFEVILKLLDSLREQLHIDISENVVAGILASVAPEIRKEILNFIVSKLGLHDEVIKESWFSFLLSTPFDQYSWDIISLVPPMYQSRYWSETKVPYHKADLIEVYIGIENLLQYNRPFDAFNLAYLNWQSIDSYTIHRILTTVANEKKNKDLEAFNISPNYIISAIDILNERKDISNIKVVNLELSYMGVLRYERYRHTALKKEILDNPTFFIELIMFIYNRDDNKEDSEEFLERKNGLDLSIRFNLEQVFGDLLLLTEFKKGTAPWSKLNEWIDTTLELAQEVGRRNKCEYIIGKLLTNYQKSDEMCWSSESIRNIIERLNSPHVNNGVYMGIANAGGVAWRSLDGASEWNDHDRYNDLYERLYSEFPNLASVMKSLAESNRQRAIWLDRSNELSQFY